MDMFSDPGQDCTRPPVDNSRVLKKESPRGSPLRRGLLPLLRGLGDTPRYNLFPLPGQEGEGGPSGPHGGWSKGFFITLLES